MSCVIFPKLFFVVLIFNYAVLSSNNYQLKAGDFVETKEKILLK